VPVGTVFVEVQLLEGDPMRLVSTSLAALLSVALVGCAQTGSVLDTKTKQGAVLGTLAGAAAGAAIGGSDHRAGGALIGAAAGGLTGGLVGRYLDQQAAELDAIPGADVEKRDDSILVNFQGGLLFDSGSASLQPGGYDRLRSMAQTLNSYPRSHVIVKGHTDSVGDEQFNQRLSEERSDRVRNFLIAEGVHPSRVTAIGFGESLPLASNATDTGRAQNRRVEVEIRPHEDVMREGAAQ
jgi:outer membrane protein OmpA-like peptidoglycan-associated protein